MTRFFLSTLLALTAHALSAQCISIVNCNPMDTLAVCAEPANNPELWNNPSFNAVFNGSDDLFEGAAKLTLTAAKTPNCTGTTHVRFVLQLDLDADDLPETFVDSDQLPAPGTVLYNNGSLPGTVVSWDTRNVPEADKYQFTINWHETADSVFAELAFHTASQPGAYLAALLPQGAQAVLWEVSNNGSVSSCTQHFFVKDCTPPTVTCNTLELSLQSEPPGVTVWSTDLILFENDNTTPLSFLQNSAALTIGGVFFSPSVTFSCGQLGPQAVEVWVYDEWGNQSFCVSQVSIEDPLGLCGNQQLEGAEICVKVWCDNAVLSGIDDIAVTFNSNGGVPLAVEHPDNCELISIPPNGQNITVEIAKNDDMLNGVSVLDLWRTARHILGIEPFTHHAQLIAADANKSGSVTTYDIVLLSMLMLDMPVDPLALRPSWSFVDSALLADLPLNEVMNLQAIALNAPFPDYLYIPISAIKTGDVTCDALPAAAPGSDERAVDYISLPDWTLAAGEEIEVPLTFVQGDYRTAFQLGLGYDPALLEVTDYSTTIYNSGNPELVNNDLPGQFNLLWFNAQDNTFYASGSEIVRLKVRALAPLALRDVFFLQSGTPQSISSLSYQSATEKALQLDFTTGAPEEGMAPMFSVQVTPNPVTTSGATLTMQSTQAQTAVFSVFDATGRRCATWMQELPTGKSAIELPAGMFSSGVGVYSCTVTTGEHGTISRHIVKL